MAFIVDLQMLQTVKKHHLESSQQTDQVEVIKAAIAFKIH
jgi:hypothetical protein